MKDQKPKAPEKGAVKKLRDLFEKRRGRVSGKLAEILNTPSKQEDDQKKSALPAEKDAEI